MIFLIEIVVSGEHFFYMKNRQFAKRDLAADGSTDLYVFADYSRAIDYLRAHWRQLGNSDRKIVVPRLKNGKLIAPPSLINVRAFRDRRPANVLFCLRDVKDVIKNGSDARPNRLIITYDGDPAVVSADKNCDKSNYAVSSDIFPAYNHYFGPGASEDENYVGNLYLQLLRGWRDHLRYMGKHIDFNNWQGEKSDEAQLKADILRLVGQYS
ncbi:MULTISPECIES: hypothetical protein [unclassified Sporolactobacillus]|uniref:hypothetical protein n=1 Tax=unclassified Sporolactobacillus TaxID=2628533 RepID=UPI002367FD56|nr:hypothetical protein [Sporolactobacillus sp. CQH2019]MDD9148869.1 hypothetical protein [Sporolactobacillus sp. CQH2019]